MQNCVFMCACMPVCLSQLCFFKKSDCNLTLLTKQRHPHKYLTRSCVCTCSNKHISIRERKCSKYKQVT